MRRLAIVLISALALAGCGAGTHTKTGPTGVKYTVKTVNGLRAYTPPNPAHSPAFQREARYPPATALRGLRPTTTSVYRWYDDVTISTIRNYSSSPVAIGCYITGPYANCGTAHAYFPGAHLIPIATYATVRSGYRMLCLDVEPGDASPSQAGSWARSERSLGVLPCVYGSISSMGSIRFYLSQAGLSRSMYRLWDAYWTFSFHLDAGYDATQFYGGNVIDISAGTASFLGVGPPPPPPDPYRRMDKTLRKFPNSVTAREYNTVKTWKTRRCEQPARRTVCKTTTYHERLLAGRAWFVAHHKLVRGHWVRTSAHWDAGAPPTLGIRFHVMFTELSQKRATCSTCLP